MIEYEPPLSDEGLKRREAILDLARGAARSLRHRRFIRRGLTGIVGVAGMIAIANVLWFRPPHSPNSIGSQSVALATTAATIERIPTDPTITGRLSVLPSPRWQQIDDDELLQSLASSGQPAGLVQTEGETILLTTPLDQ